MESLVRSEKIERGLTMKYSSEVTGSKYGVGGPLPLPPYGIMSDGLQVRFEEAPDKAPRAFQAKPAWLAASTDWLTLKSDLIHKIKESLWPVWNAETEEWEGASADTMKELTRVDLALCSQLRDSMQILKVPPKAPNPPSAVPDGLKNHGDFYRSEDEKHFLGTIEVYDKDVNKIIDVNKTIKDELIAHYDSSSKDTFSNVPQQFKAEFQRPRPWQAAYLMKEKPVNPLRAISAGSPAFPAGHPIQALLGIGAVLEKVHANPPTPKIVEALQQLAVDIGDRRCFAGLHYPSDMIASWIIVMGMAPHLFSPAVTDLLCDAITNKSIVYAEVSKEPAYTKALALLPKCLSRVDRALVS
jgi:hypothetical protein